MDDDHDFIWAFGRKIPRSQLRRIPLDMDPPAGSTGDMYDDDYWAWVMFRKPVTGFRRIEELSRQLQAEEERERPRPGVQCCCRRPEPQ